MPPTRKIGLERANVLGMVATQSAYTNGQAWIEEVTEVIKENLRVLVNFLEKYNNLFSYVVPQASFWSGFHMKRWELMKIKCVNCLMRQSAM